MAFQGTKIQNFLLVAKIEDIHIEDSDLNFFWKGKAVSEEKNTLHQFL